MLNVNKVFCLIACYLFLSLARLVTRLGAQLINCEYQMNSLCKNLWKPRWLIIHKLNANITFEKIDSTSHFLLSFTLSFPLPVKLVSLFFFKKGRVFARMVCLFICFMGTFVTKINEKLGICLARNSNILLVTICVFFFKSNEKKHDSSFYCNLCSFVRNLKQNIKLKRKCGHTEQWN